MTSQTGLPDSLFTQNRQRVRECHPLLRGETNFTHNTSPITAHVKLWGHLVRLNSQRLSENQNSYLLEGPKRQYTAASIKKRGSLNLLLCSFHNNLAHSWRGHCIATSTYGKRTAHQSFIQSLTLSAIYWNFKSRKAVRFNFLLWSRVKTIDK